MKRAIFVLFLALFIFFGCDDGKSNKLGQGGSTGGEDWSSVTGYNCASIDRCVKGCASNDKACQADCIGGGSDEARKIYADLETCISYNCAFMSDDETADCADDSCSRELESCGLKEPHAGGGNNSGDSGDKPDSGGAPCTNPGALKCSSSTMVQKCDEETLVWTNYQKCKSDQTCERGKCVVNSGGSIGGDSGNGGDTGSTGGGSGDSGSVTGYNCASIDRCVKGCGPDEGCQADCIGGGSDEARKIYVDLDSCIRYNCAFLSDDEAADCINKFCANELGLCGLKEPADGGGNNSGGGAPCTKPGALKCSSPTMVQKCDKETLVWRDFQKCKPDQLCKEGKCVAKTGGNGGNTGGDSGGSTGGPGLPSCGKGSATPCLDSKSGLVWSAKASSSMYWDDAITHCNNLTEGGFSDWRLPSISELRTLIRECPATMTGGSCGVTDSCLESSCWSDPCNGCDYDNTGKYSLFGDTYWFWSSSPVAGYPGYAWDVDFNGGGVSFHDIGNGSDVRCVR